MKFFSKLSYLFFGYFDPLEYFLIIKINKFRGDLSDISAKTGTLVQAHRRQEATEIRNRRMRDATIPPATKHALQCEHVKTWGRTIFACPTCWLMPYFCVCGKYARFTPKTKVILHLHHEEWCVSCVWVAALHPMSFKHHRVLCIVTLLCSDHETCLLRNSFSFLEHNSRSVADSDFVFRSKYNLFRIL